MILIHIVFVQSLVLLLVHFYALTANRNTIRRWSTTKQGRLQLTPRCSNALLQGR